MLIFNFIYVYLIFFHNIFNIVSVGSFVWSHLKNILTSSSPSRIEIQSLLTDQDLGNKFNNDFRKFSRNYESSFFLEEYNIGANYQMNIIFSPNSYLPRTISLNFTFDLLGESINIYELNVRTEGFELYAENFFGPNGPFSGVNVAKKFQQFLRFFRSTNYDGIKTYWSKIKSLPYTINNNFDQPYMSLSYKVFGNEIELVFLENDSEIRKIISHLNPWKKIKHILSGKESMHYENTALFLDSTYIIPSTSGLPINLIISGSFACNMNVSGVLNAEKFMSNGELQIIGNVLPR